MNALPELNDPDLYFRVNLRSVELRKHLPDTEWSENLCLGGGRQGICEEREILSVSRRWFVTQHITKTEYRYVNVSVSLGAAYTELEREYTDQRGVTQRTYREITRKDIPVLAQKALQEYEDDLERKSLLGDYPPKRFEVDDSE